MTYERFAHVYDFLMGDAPYEEWMDFFQRHAANLSGKGVLDLACGTGEFTWRLAEAGWHVTGVDLSDDMLFVAQQKAAAKNLSIPLFQQDMRELEGLESFDAITIFCDSLNYLTEEEDVKRTFQSAEKHLKPGGLFLFDVHSLFKMRHVFKDGTFTAVDEVVSYIWNCFDGEKPDSIEHELTFFARDEKADLYERFDELHTQRTFAPGQYETWLQEAGFTNIETTADFTEHPPGEESQRIFFVCRKAEAAIRA
ncbi:methyltransferase domain-containing protein [Bacillus aerolatus]|uniref:Methyltransferase domain-containing protein n=1 Tax=Bacillus aerolatus TaxID=2653354 RepID=A0A6I1FJ69_9BACI|nr:class I SAM-dependent methyltransferase [Bacillus aerolatus]KAB7708708.1 methyltransferase domain-containing protein [Bacillus aerolatus]